MNMWLSAYGANNLPLFPCQARFDVRVAAGAFSLDRDGCRHLHGRGPCDERFDVFFCKWPSSFVFGCRQGHHERRDNHG